MGHAPENTLASVNKALELGAPCLEIDVFYVDGHIIVFHDERLERTTNGSGLLSEQTFEQLRALDAGDGERIATLDEICERVAGHAALNIELKGPGTAVPVSAQIAKYADRGWPQDYFLLSSYDRQQLLQARRLNKDIKLGLIIKEYTHDDVSFARDLGAFSIHPSLDCINAALVDEAHSSGLQVYVYTVNRPEELAAMHKLGVDGVFTNFPERVLDNYAQANAGGRWTSR